MSETYLADVQSYIEQMRLCMHSDFLKILGKTIEFNSYALNSIVENMKKNIVANLVFDTETLMMDSTKNRLFSQDEAFKNIIRRGTVSAEDFVWSAMITESECNTALIDWLGALFSIICIKSETTNQLRKIKDRVDKHTKANISDYNYFYLYWCIFFLKKFTHRLEKPKVLSCLRILFSQRHILTNDQEIHELWDDKEKILSEEDCFYIMSVIVNSPSYDLYTPIADFSCLTQDLSPNPDYL